MHSRRLDSTGKLPPPSSLPHETAREYQPRVSSIYIAASKRVIVTSSHSISSLYTNYNPYYILFQIVTRIYRVIRLLIGSKVVPWVPREGFMRPSTITLVHKHVYGLNFSVSRFPAQRVLSWSPAASQSPRVSLYYKHLILATENIFIIYPDYSCIPPAVTTWSSTT